MITCVHVYVCMLSQFRARGHCLMRNQNGLLCADTPVSPSAPNVEGTVYMPQESIFFSLEDVTLVKFVYLGDLSLGCFLLLLLCLFLWHV